MDELERHFEKIIRDQNDQGLPGFEGYSPAEMYYILYDTFGETSPIKLLKLSDSDYRLIPILNQIKYLIRIIDNHNELKLTNKGFLPTKIVSDIYNQGFIKDERVESGISKIYKETDSNTINLTRILIEISGLVKKRNNKLSLTRKSRSIIADNYKLLSLIFEIFGSKFNWAYYDGYGQNTIGQIGFGFTLILLSKYGSKKRLDKFYSDKYFTAFPRTVEEVTESYHNSKKVQAERCYSLRTFDRFLDYFGVIKIENEDKWDSDNFIIKTELFDKLIKSTPHNKMYKSLGNDLLN